MWYRRNSWKRNCICSVYVFCQGVLHRDDTKPYSHQQYMRVPVSSLPIQKESQQTFIFDIISKIKKAEYWRIDAFKLWFWRRVLRVPWTARRSNQSILKEISPEDSLEGLMLKLKLQYFGHLMRRTDSLEKTLMLGKIEGKRRRGWQTMRWLDGISKSMNMRLSELRETVKDRESWHAAVHGAAKSQTWLSDWITTTNR